MNAKFGTRTPRYAAALIAATCLVTSVGCDRSEPTPAPQAAPLVLDRVPSGIKPREHEFGGKVRLLGYSIKSPLKAGRRSSVTMYWQAKDKVEPGYRLVSELVDDAGARVLDLDNAGPLREHKDGKPLLPPEAWQPGKVYVDQLSFTVPASVKTWRVILMAGLKKGEEAMKLNNPEVTDGMAFVLSSGTGVRRQARPNEAPVVRVDRLDPKQKIKVDGKLDDEAWKDAPLSALSDHISRRPTTRAGLAANVRLVHDKTGLYVGFEVKDSDVVGGFDAHLAAKDGVEILIDPEEAGDSLDYYDIQLGPQNVVFDTHHETMYQPAEDPKAPIGKEEWASGIKSAVTIQGTLDKSDDKDEGYVVEAFVPWKSLNKAKKVPPGVGDVWRVNFYAFEETGTLAWTPPRKKGESHNTAGFSRVLWAEKGFVPKIEADAGTEATAVASAAASAAGSAVALPKEAAAAGKNPAVKLPPSPVAKPTAPPGAPAAAPRPPAAPMPAASGK